MAGIASAGYYLPKYSISAEEYRKAWGFFAARGVQEKTVAAFDEDEVTMAVEASFRAMEGTPGEKLGLVAFASSGTRPGSGTLAEALGSYHARTIDTLGSSGSGVAALLAAADFVGSSDRFALIATGDSQRARPADSIEHGLGAAGTAFLITSAGGLVLEAASSRSRDETGGRFVDEKGDVKDPGVVDIASDLLGLAIEDLSKESTFDLAVVQDTKPKMAAAAGKVVGKDKVRGGVGKLTGDTGSSSVFLNLIQAIAESRSGQRIVLGASGGGGATAVSLFLKSELTGDLDVMASMKRDRVLLNYAQYLQARKYISGDRQSLPSQGAYVSLPTYMAETKARYRLVAEECKNCNRLHFPPRESCLDCGGREFVDRPLSKRGKIYSYTVIGRGAAPTEFADQQAATGEYAVAVVELDEGPKATGQMADCEPRQVKIGDRVEAVFRRIYIQDDVPRYGFKFRPLRAT